MAGETRWVRPLKPWRPSKLRFEVEAQRSPGLEPVGVHGEAHRAARLAPLEAGGDEDLVEALGLGLLLHQAGARHDHGADAVVRPCLPATILAAARRSSMRPLVQEPMKTRSMRDVGDLRAGLEAHIGERALDRARGWSGSAIVGRVGHRAGRSVTTSSGLVPQVTIGGSVGGVEPDLAVEMRALVGVERLPVAQRHVPGRALRRLRAALDIGEGRLVRRDQAGARAALDRHVADRHAAFHRQRRGSPRRHIR